MAAEVGSAAGAAAPLTSDELRPVIAAAEQEWASAGIAPARFAGVTFVITGDLPLGEIGYADGATIYLDATAAGFGWYAGSGADFAATGVALRGGPAAGRMDLLTVVLHELGHTIGLPDGCACGPFAELMQATLSAGVRRLLLPAAAAPTPPGATIETGGLGSQPTIPGGAAAASVRVRPASRIAATGWITLTAPIRLISAGPPRAGRVHPRHVAARHTGGDSFASVFAQVRRFAVPRTSVASISSV